MPRYSMIRVISMVLTGGGLAALAACTDNVVLDGSAPECTTNADCAADGAADTICVEGRCRVPAAETDAAVYSVWDCLGKVPAVAAEPSVPVTVPFRFLDGLSTTTRAGVEVVACSGGDVDCASPLPGSAATSNASGDVDVPVFSGFQGDFKLTGEGLATQFIAALPVPDKSRMAARMSWSLFRREEFHVVAAASGGGLPRGDLAHVLFVAVDCEYHPVAEVAVSPDVRSPETYGFYTDSSNTPSLTLSATEREGAGGYVNLPPGARTFTVRRTNGATVGTHTVTLRPGAITLVVLPPS